MRCLVTGGAGFIGSHLVDALLARGDEVIVLDNLLIGSPANVNPAATFRLVDISDPLPRWARFFKGVDQVFHLAAVPRPEWCLQRPVQSAQINIVGTLNVLMAAKAGGVRRFVNTSSSVVVAPATPYSASKAAGEGYVAIFSRLYGLSTISLRPSCVYGSLRQSEEGVGVNAIASLRKSKRENGYVWLTGDGTQTRDFVHVNDTVGAFLLAAESEREGPYDVCTGVQTSMNEIAAYFDCPIVYVAPRRGDAHAVVSDPFPAWHDLGFESRVGLSEGIKVYL